MKTSIICLCGSFTFKLSEYRGAAQAGLWVDARVIVEINLASYLSPEKPCQTTLRLVGRAYAEAGQTGGALHTMAGG